MEVGRISKKPQGKRREKEILRGGGEGQEEFWKGGGGNRISKEEGALGAREGGELRGEQDEKEALLGYGEEGTGESEMEALGGERTRRKHLEWGRMRRVLWEL